MQGTQNSVSYRPATNVVEVRWCYTEKTLVGDSYNIIGISERSLLQAILT